MVTGTNIMWFPLVYEICILISLTKVLHNHKFAQSYLLLETIFHSNNVAHVPLNLCFSDMYRPSNF